MGSLVCNKKKPLASEKKERDRTAELVYRKMNQKVIQQRMEDTEEWAGEGQGGEAAEL